MYSVFLTCWFFIVSSQTALLEKCWVENLIASAYLSRRKALQLPFSSASIVYGADIPEQTSLPVSLRTINDEVYLPSRQTESTTTSIFP